MSDFNCKHPDLIVQRNFGHRWVTCTECNTDFLPADAARRQASLTSPETIEAGAKALYERTSLRGWDVLPDIDRIDWIKDAEAVLEKAIEAVEWALDAQNQIPDDEAAVLLDAARRWDELTSPETIEAWGTVREGLLNHDMPPVLWSALGILDHHFTVLRSVEEGKT